MSITIPEDFADLLTREKKAFAHIALVVQEDIPHVSPIWFEYNGEHIVINTARGRVKDKVLRKHPAVALCISDPGNPYRYLLVWGDVVEETEVGAYDVICDLNEKYHGKREFPRPPGQVRVTYKILPDHIFASK